MLKIECPCVNTRFPRVKEKTMIKKCFIFGLVVCSIALNPSGFAGTWKDSFEDRNTQEWEVIGRELKEWWIDGGEAVGETLEHNILSAWVTGDVAWRNYTISCRAKLTEVKGQFPHLGLVLHYDDKQNSLYLFEIVSDWKEFGFITLEKLLPPPASSVKLGQFNFVPKANKWYTLTASVSRRALEFQIDDQVFTAIDNSPLKSGKTGLFVVNGQARFDDVKITGTNIPNGGPGKARPVNPQAKLATTWGHLKSK